MQTNWLYYCGYLETVWPHACTDMQEDFLSNIVHFSNVGSMLGHRRRRWPNIKTALCECLVGVASSLVIWRHASLERDSMCNLGFISLWLACS